MDKDKRKKEIAKQLGQIAGHLKRATNPNTIRALKLDRERLKSEFQKLEQDDPD